MGVSATGTTHAITGIAADVTIGRRRNLPSVHPGSAAMNVVTDIVWWIMIVVGMGCGATFLLAMWQLFFPPRR